MRDVFPARNQQKNADKGEEIIFRKRKKQIKIAMNLLINKINYSICYLLLLLEYANSLIISTQRYMFVTSQKAAVMCTLNRQLPNLFVQAIEWVNVVTESASCYCQSIFTSSILWHCQDLWLYAKIQSYCDPLPQQGHMFREKT